MDAPFFDAIPSRAAERKESVLRIRPEVRSLNTKDSVPSRAEKAAGRRRALGLLARPQQKQAQGVERPSGMKKMGKKSPVPNLRRHAGHASSPFREARAM